MINDFYDREVKIVVREADGEKPYYGYIVEEDDIFIKLKYSKNDRTILINKKDIQTIKEVN